MYFFSLDLYLAIKTMSEWSEELLIVWHVEIFWERI